MEAILVTLGAVAGGVWLVFAAHRLDQARVRIGVLRNQRRRDSRLRR